MKNLFIYLCWLLPLGLFGQNMVHAEYFIDTDPGEANATTIPILTPNSVVDLNFTVNLLGISEGLHTLAIRMQDENGKWSLVQTRPFYKSSAISSTVISITEAEYFINTDPGEGNGINIPISIPNATQDLNFIADISSLPVGLHIFGVRIKDENGKWGLVQTRPFYKPNVVANQTTNITAIEYAIDTDGGIGQNTIVNVNPANPTIDENFVVDVSSLSLGDHYLLIRARDEYGNWGITQMDTISIHCDTAVVAFNASNVCIGDTVLLTDLSTNVNSEALYKWDVDGNGMTDYTNKDSIFHVFTSPGTYNASLTVRNNLICEFTQIQPITVNPLPIASAGADQTICSGTSANLSATGGTSYQWNSGQSGANIAVSPTVTTT